MANFKRNKPRLRTFRGYSMRAGAARFDKYHSAWMCSWPAWHDILHHRRPPRRKTAALERAVLSGADADAIAWPTGKRPHLYYW